MCWKVGRETSIKSGPKTMGQIGGVDRQVGKQALEVDRKVWGGNLFYLLLNRSLFASIL